jgi:hypothetical protein
MMALQQNKPMAVIAYLFLIIAAVDVLTQYTPLNIFGLRLNFVLILLYMLVLPFLARVRFKKSDIVFLCVIVLSLALNYNSYSFSDYEYLKVSSYTLLFIFSYLLIIRLKGVILSAFFIEFIIFFSLANIIGRFYLSEIGAVHDWNYNWSAILFITMLLILYKNSHKLVLIIFPLSFLMLYIGSRGAFLAGFIFSLTLLAGKFGMLPKIKSEILPHLFSLIMIITPFVLIWLVMQNLDDYGRISLGFLGKSGQLSGRELGYALYFDRLSDQGGVVQTLIFGGGAQQLYVISDNENFIDDYAYIYSASLQFILFFGLPIAHWFFVKVGRFIVSLDCGDGFKYALMAFVVILSVSYSVLSLMHFSLGFLILLLGVKIKNPIKSLNRSSISSGAASKNVN